MQSFDPRVPYIGPSWGPSPAPDVMVDRGSAIPTKDVSNEPSYDSLKKSHLVLAPNAESLLPKVRINLGHLASSLSESLSTGSCIPDVFLINASAAQAVGGPMSARWHLSVCTQDPLAQPAHAEAYKKWIFRTVTDYLQAKIQEVQPFEGDAALIYHAYEMKIYAFEQGIRCQVGPIIIEVCDCLLHYLNISPLDGMQVSLLTGRARCVVEGVIASADDLTHAIALVKARELCLREGVSEDVPDLFMHLLNACSEGVSIDPEDWAIANSQLATKDFATLYEEWLDFQRGHFVVDPNLQPRAILIDYLNFLSQVQNTALCESVCKIWMQARESLSFQVGYAFTLALAPNPTFTPHFLNWIRGVVLLSYLQSLGNPASAIEEQAANCEGRDLALSARPVQMWEFPFSRTLRPSAAFFCGPETRHLSLTAPDQSRDPLGVAVRFCESVEFLGENNVDLGVFDPILETLGLSPWVDLPDVVTLMRDFDKAWNHPTFQRLMLNYPDQRCRGAPFLPWLKHMGLPTVNQTAHTVETLKQQCRPSESQSSNAGSSKLLKNLESASPTVANVPTSGTLHPLLSVKFQNSARQREQDAEAQKSTIDGARVTSLFELKDPPSIDLPGERTSKYLAPQPKAPVLVPSRNEGLVNQHARFLQTKPPSRSAGVDDASITFSGLLKKKIKNGSSLVPDIEGLLENKDSGQIKELLEMHLEDVLKHSEYPFHLEEVLGLIIKYDAYHKRVIQLAFCMMVDVFGDTVDHQARCDVLPFLRKVCEHWQICHQFIPTKAYESTPLKAYLKKITSLNGIFDPKMPKTILIDTCTSIVSIFPIHHELDVDDAEAKVRVLFNTVFNRYLGGDLREDLFALYDMCRVRGLFSEIDALNWRKYYYFARSMVSKKFYSIHERYLEILTRLNQVANPNKLRHRVKIYQVYSEYVTRLIPYCIREQASLQAADGPKVHTTELLTTFIATHWSSVSVGPMEISLALRETRKLCICLLYLPLCCRVLDNEKEAGKLATVNQLKSQLTSEELRDCSAVVSKVSHDLGSAGLKEVSSANYIAALAPVIHSLLTLQKGLLSGGAEESENELTVQCVQRTLDLWTAELGADAEAVVHLRDSFKVSRIHSALGAKLRQNIGIA